MKKDRGVFLTILLVISGIGLLQSLYLLTNTSLVAQSYGSVPDWFSMYEVFSVIIAALIIVGLWTMKKWGVYLVFLSMATGLAMQLFVLKPLMNAQMSYTITILVDALWVWAIYRKWKSFS